MGEDAAPALLRESRESRELSTSFSARRIEGHRSDRTSQPAHRCALPPRGRRARYPMTHGGDTAQPQPEIPPSACARHIIAAIVWR